MTPRTADGSACTAHRTSSSVPPCAQQQLQTPQLAHGNRTGVEQATRGESTEPLAMAAGIRVAQATKQIEAMLAVGLGVHAAGRMRAGPPTRPPPAPPVLKATHLPPVHAPASAHASSATQPAQQASASQAGVPAVLRADVPVQAAVMSRIQTRIYKPGFEHQGMVDWATGALNLMMDRPHPSDSLALRDLNRYVRYLMERTRCPAECLPVALVYLSRILRVPGCIVTAANVHALFVAAFVLASKYLEDCVLYMRDWAEVSGFDLKLLVRMERDMLRLLQWNVVVQYDQYLSMIEESKKQIAAAAGATSVLMVSAGEKTRAG